ncbi:hypothetical protein [Parasphingorhabdus cellanae]|nr:hypothetical protein [Parasphingorhabdus cellanae]
MPRQIAPAIHRNALLAITDGQTLHGSALFKAHDWSNVYFT